MSEGRRLPVIPLMLLGDGQVGKTSLSLTLTKNKFEDSLLTTVGKESYTYLTTLHGHDIKIKIWDTAGQERFKSMSVSVIKTVDGLILVYSITSQESFRNLESWMKSVKDIADLSKKPVIIVGNKCDLEDMRMVTYEEGKQYATKLGYHFYETSAKTGENLKEAFNDIFEQLYDLKKDDIEGGVIKKKNTFNLGQQNNKKGCCQH